MATKKKEEEVVVEEIKGTARNTPELMNEEQLKAHREKEHYRLWAETWRVSVDEARERLQAQEKQIAKEITAPRTDDSAAEGTRAADTPVKKNIAAGS